MTKLLPTEITSKIAHEPQVMKKIKLKTILSYFVFYFFVRFGEILLRKFDVEESESLYWNFEEVTKVGLTIFPQFLNPRRFAVTFYKVCL